MFKIFLCVVITLFAGGCSFAAGKKLGIYYSNRGLLVHENHELVKPPCFPEKKEENLINNG